MGADTFADTLRPHRLLVAAYLALAGFGVLLLVQAALAARGPREPFDDPSRAPLELGDGGAPLTYLVLGDSTSAGQGAPYERGIALGTARHLARSQRVTMVNASIAGAEARDVLASQVELAAALRPHLTLVSVGANDVTGLTGRRGLRRALDQMVDELIAARCDMRIVLTGVPEMGVVPRLGRPLRWLAGVRTRQLNDVFGDLAHERELTLVPLAAVTGPIFRRDPDLFAADRYHPNAGGYAVWLPVLERSLDRALAEQPSHCR